MTTDKSVTLDTARRTLKNKHQLKVSTDELRTFLGDSTATHIKKSDIERYIAAHTTNGNGASAPEPAAAPPPADAVLKAPVEWMHELRPGEQIVDADGWRGKNAKSFQEPITREEFLERLATCTRSMPPDVQPADQPSSEDDDSALAAPASAPADDAAPASSAMELAPAGEVLHGEVVHATTSRELTAPRTRRRPSSKGAFAPTRLMNRGRIKLTQADREVLKLMQIVLQTVDKYKGRRREPIPGRRGTMGVADLLRPERIIWMELAEYQARSLGGTLPVLHDDTKEELAMPLSRLSLVNHDCRICLQPLETPHYKGMLERLLNGDCELPFRPGHHDAMKFREFHSYCPTILEMMAAVEVDLSSMPEGDEKEERRWVTYMARLQENDNEMLNAFMASEYRKLSGEQAMARFRAIYDHVMRQREMY